MKQRFDGTAKRDLVIGFLRRDLQSRYRGTVLGGVWALGQPVLLLGIYALVFSKVLRVQLPDLAPNSFVAFLACTLWPWLAFQEAVQRATQVVVANGDLVRKIAFPSQLLVLASVGASFCVHAVGHTVVLALLWATGEPLHSAGWLLVPLAWGVLFVLACGLALLTASLQVVMKDIDHMLGPLFMLLFYATPILYPLSLVPVEFRAWMMFNPLIAVFEPMRAGLFDGQWAAASELLPVAVAAVALCVSGAWVFRRLAVYFEDFL